MKISQIRISRRSDPKLKALVSFVIEDSIVVHGFKIIAGNSGLFVAMPSRKRADGQHQDIAHPVNDITRRALTSAVLEAYLAGPEPPTPLEAVGVPAVLPRGPAPMQCGAMRAIPSRRREWPDLPPVRLPLSGPPSAG